MDLLLCFVPSAVFGLLGLAFIGPPHEGPPYGERHAWGFLLAGFAVGWLFGFLAGALP